MRINAPRRGGTLGPVLIAFVLGLMIGLPLGYWRPKREPLCACCCTEQQGECLCHPIGRTRLP
jgi:hypothetical protein